MNKAMEQKVDHLTKGDLICVLLGYSHNLVTGIYHKCRKSIVENRVVSITYIRLQYSHTEPYYEHIRTRHSYSKRVFKITEDNLNAEELEIYKKYCNKTRIAYSEEYLKTLTDDFIENFPQNKDAAINNYHLTESGTQTIEQAIDNLLKLKEENEQPV